MKEILDVQRDLHANDYAVCEEYTLRLERFYLHVPPCQRESPFAQCLMSLAAYF